MRLFHLIAFSITLLGAFGCRKPLPEKVFVPFTEEAKSFALFPEGSYWIYTDSSNAIDSISISMYLLDTISDNHGGGCLRENCYLEMTRSFYGYSLSGALSTDCNGQIESLNFGMQTLYVRGFTKTSTNPDVLEEIVPGVDAGLAVYEAHYDSLPVSGNHYNDVRQFLVKQSLGSSYPRRVYFARGIGVVKMEMEGGEVWELIRYGLE